MIHRDAGLPADIEDLRDGQTIEGDGVTLVALHTPGHASDHLCYYLAEEKAVFTGDVVLGGSTTVIPAEDGDLLDYMSSLKRLQSLDVRRIYPAHGPVIEDAQGRLAEYVEHRLLRERQILAALGDGLTTIPTMVARIYADVPVNLHAMAGQSVRLATGCMAACIPRPHNTARSASSSCASGAPNKASTASPAYFSTIPP